MSGNGNEERMVMKDYKISVVVPVYNEENGITPFLERTERVMEDLECDYEIIFSLDPSKDRTYEVIKEHMEENHHIKLITMSRRFRQAAATMAGVLNCSGDACVVIDVDLQDPPEVITELVEKWEEGYDVVYAQRIDRQGEYKFRKLWASAAYRVINFLSSPVEIPVDTADFRLIDRKVIEELRKMPESNMFFRGMVAYIGFKQIAVRYHREAREADTSKYNKMFGDIRMGFHGLFCFSSKPLEYITFLGLFITGIGGLLSTIFAFQKAVLKKDRTIVKGTSALLWLIGGIQIFASGILGEYVSRIYDDVKCRQRFIIDEFDKNEK